MCARCSRERSYGRVGRGVGNGGTVMRGGGVANGFGIPGDGLGASDGLGANPQMVQLKRP